MAQSSTLLEHIRPNRFYVILKFRITLKYDSIDQADFTLAKDGTPVADPFRPISLDDDYDSLRRELTLYYRDAPDTPGTLALTISGLENSSGAPLNTETLTYEYEFDNTGVEEPTEDTPTVDIVDKSIKADLIFDADRSSFANPDFYITRSDPTNGDIFVEEDHKKGRVSIAFSSRPAVAYVNSEYIKVQRKEIGPGLHRWENVAAQFALDAHSPTILISYPSNTDPALYNTAGLTYFEAGYKYRIRFSSEIAPSE